MAVEHTPAESGIVRRTPHARKRTKIDLTRFFPLWTHPDVLYWAPTWTAIRDCIMGETQIKSKSTTYLPPLDEQTDTEYDNYLDRSVFFNMSQRTVQALAGMVFEKTPKVVGLPDREIANFKNPTRSGVSLTSFLKTVTAEVITMGRCGVLCDMDVAGKAMPYFAHYTAENILDWSEAEIDGKITPVEIALREIVEIPRVFGTPRNGLIRFRILRLETDPANNTLVYRQYIYETTALDANLGSMTPIVVTPTLRGKSFNRIPFRFIGSMTNTPDIDRAPLADISALNLSHYKAYAQLEHGRFYTAMPIYYVTAQQGSTGDYRLGASVVWEVGMGEKPGVIEFNGAGLKYLESSCAQKEDQIAALGGRLMGGKGRSTGESDNEVKLKEGNERSILLNACMGINDAMSALLGIWLEWRDYPPEVTGAAGIELSTKFLMDTLGAREIRAIYAMYKDGVVPITVLHYYLQQAEAIPDWMDADEFKKLLDTEQEFPNQPDVLAKMRGFNTNAEMLNDQLKKREAAVRERLAGVKEEEVVIEGELAQNEIDNPAAVMPKIPPVRPGTAK